LFLKHYLRYRVWTSHLLWRSYCHLKLSFKLNWFSNLFTYILHYSRRGYPLFTYILHYSRGDYPLLTYILHYSRGGYPLYSFCFCFVLFLFPCRNLAQYWNVKWRKPFQAELTSISLYVNIRVYSHRNLYWLSRGSTIKQLIYFTVRTTCSIYTTYVYWWVAFLSLSVFCLFSGFFSRRLYFRS
jgi:hypothetical protein